MLGFAGSRSGRQILARHRYERRKPTSSSHMREELVQRLCEEEKLTESSCIEEKSGKHRKAALTCGKHRKAALTCVLLLLFCAALLSCQPRTAEPADGTSGTGEADAAGSVGNAATTDLADFQWKATSSCTTCHAKEAQTTEASPCPQEGSAPEACMTCHIQEAELLDVHKDVSTAEDPQSSRLKSTTVDESICLSCHGSYTELATRTTKVDVLTDDNGLTINPHALPSTGNHNDVTCVSCHVTHGKKNAARRVCIGCHHMTVWECNTCHPYEYDKQ